MAGNLTINEPTVPQLVAMADGLVATGELRMAGQLYGVALRRATAKARRAIRLRIGIASSTTTPGMNLDILKLLEAEDTASPFVGAGLATWWKTLPFMEDPRFVELCDRHAALLPLANWQWNLQSALWCVRQVKDVPGDFVELGVFKGHTTLFCAEYVGFQDWPRRWWLYDTFEGIPDDQVAPGWEQTNKNLYEGTFSFEEVTARFSAFPNIDVIQGRVPEVLAQGSPDTIAFMHIDMNNPTAEIGALEALFERVSSGGIILFDDFAWATARAQYVAETRWFAARGLHVLALPTGQGLFVKR
ncbi:TylF/MycF/NovP-related O-methyltransferase [Phenylobacterium sp.]|uniref:TylF/MycF/NovP-related O-methyltransferase n=1 Tax=Phenylobacterium sp. TaxID=1871053 RepID=UPI0025CE42A4|nr:TylF/MycF/NovP-related O-methyltransferase [Phenylobacterium sp.]